MTATVQSDPPADPAKLAAARLWAVTKMPYLARALFACTVRWAPSTHTIAVNQFWQLDADPAVVQQLETDQLGRLLIHLAAHLVRDHAGRAETARVCEDDGRAHWNRAADAEINDDLRSDDCVPQAAPDLPADLGCADGGLAEFYYQNGAPGERAWDCGAGADGGAQTFDVDRGHTGLGSAESELLRLGVAADIQRGHRSDPGTIPAGWLLWAETKLPSRTDWRRVLAAEIRKAAAAVAGNVDYSYRRPSRRAMSSPGVVVASMYRPVPEVAIVCDTSGSMHEQLLARALAEIDALLNRAGLRAERVRVLSVDTEVHGVARVNRARQLTLAGGGGTDMAAGIEAAGALRPRPSVIIILTDGFTPWPDRPPRGSRVVVGILTEGGLGGRMAEGWAPPAWARTVEITEN